MMRSLLSLALLFLALLAPEQVRAQLNFTTGNLALKNFTLSGADPKGQTWQLHGDNTRMQGSMVLIQNFRLQFKLTQKQEQKTSFIQPNQGQEVEVILASQNCRFNSATREIKSEAPVSIHIGKNLYVTGIGYDIDIDRKVILIRSAVTATMKKLPNTLSQRRK